ncbi:MAG TPA: MBL fold metallo-hydrolase [Terriglobia bacterium]|nr:MBL fold metallo-hydrolase [Terriglobia bacterium]
MRQVLGAGTPMAISGVVTSGRILAADHRLWFELAGAGSSAQNSVVREIAPAVYFWRGNHILRKPANCTWIAFRHYVLVIDANFPWAAREILPEIRKTTSKPIRFLFNTHYHSDHTFGNSVFVDAGAAVVSSELCNRELRTKGKMAWENWRETGRHSLQGARLEYPSILFSAKMVFDDGEQRVELVHQGGHTLGDSVAYLPRQKILVSGDLCVNWTWGNWTDVDSNFTRWIGSLGTLAQWDVRTVLPGHGSPGAREILEGQQKYISDILQHVRAGVRRGDGVDQLVREIDLSKDGSWGANAVGNARFIRAVYRKIAASTR